MESSRGGPLTTFIMMLPLIVVPAIAMLKPTDLKEGWTSRLLSAASAPETGEPVDNAPEFDEVTDEFESLFGEEMSSPSPNTTSDTEDDLFHEAIGGAPMDAFSTDFAPKNDAPAMRVQNNSSDGSAAPQFPKADASVAPLLEQLRKMGVSRTLWFTPGNEMVGFVAFFKADRGMVSYRFESIARSQPDAIQDVMQQVREWQKASER